MAKHLDREKYLKIASTLGYSEAITTLHADMEAMEQECFEGVDGYQPGIFEELKAWRVFSRELWDLFRYGRVDNALTG